MSHPESQPQCTRPFVCPKLGLVSLLVFLLSLAAFAQDEEQSKPADFLKPSGGQLTIGDEEGFGIGSQLGDPSALRGPDRTPIVLPGTERNSTLNLTGYYLAKFGENQRFLAEVNGDASFAGVDLGYMIQPQGWDGALGVNFTVSSGLASPFTDGSQVIPLSLGKEEAWVYQMGGGAEYLQSFTEDLDMAIALGYMQIQVADAQFGGNLRPFDTAGFPLTLSPDGTDDFVYLGTHGIFSTLDDRNLPTQGTKIRFGLEQALPVGSAGVSYTKFSANVAHLFAAPGLGEGPHSFLLNLQGGTILGSVPPWAGFNLGGVNSIRGYTAGDVATSKSFLQATAEYRMHLTTLDWFDQKTPIRGVAFVDYGSDLASSKEVVGSPGLQRLKPGHGAGYGLGLQAGTGGGLFRLETAWDDNGRNSFYVTVGDRF